MAHSIFDAQPDKLSLPIKLFKITSLDKSNFFNAECIIVKMKAPTKIDRKKELLKFNITAFSHKKSYLVHL